MLSTTWSSTDGTMVEYDEESGGFEGVDYVRVRYGHDELYNIQSSAAQPPTSGWTTRGESWRTPIIEYISDARTVAPPPEASWIPQ